MNSPILTFGTGRRPRGRESALPPAAKIQLPIRVRSRIQEPSAMNTSHQMTVMLMVMKPRWMLAAKMALAEANPSSSEMLARPRCRSRPW